MAISLCLLISSCIGGEDIQMDMAKKFTVIVKEKNINVEITDIDSKKSLSKILSKSPRKDSPSCPFGYIEFVIETQYGENTLYPATDGCHNFRYDTTNTYFSVNDDEWEIIMKILNNYGINRSLFESGKGI